MSLLAGPLVPIGTTPLGLTSASSSLHFKRSLFKLVLSDPNAAHALTGNLYQQSSRAAHRHGVVQASCNAADKFRQPSKIGLRLGSRISASKKLRPFSLKCSISGYPEPGCMEDRLAADVYNCVASGGTFDRLHAGHKVLLEAALRVLRPGGQLIIGVTTKELLRNKVLAELVEPYAFRVSQLEAYIHSLSPGLNCKIVPLAEPDPQKQPVASNPNLDCIVVSQETEPAAVAINKVRLSKGLKALALVVVDLLAEGSADDRLSSTELRQRDLGRLLSSKPYFQHGPRLSHKARLAPAHPYMIGLTGGIASGKTSVRRMIGKMQADGLSAETIDCDALGHLSYLPGTPSYDDIVATFGQGVVKEGGTIDRAALGAIVFGDPSQMARLTSIVWPAVRRLVAEAREEMAERGVQICIAEAALILESGCEAQMDEVWVVFVPRNIAKQRLMSRNGLSQEEAEKRINAQMTSVARVARADVAISNAGSLEETLQQLLTAWRLLEERFQTTEVCASTKNVNPPMWARWMALMDRLQVSQAVAESWWLVIHTRYTEQGRHYHNISHVQELYRLCHKYAHFLADLSGVQLAIFFHDVIYDPQCSRKGGNEADSAQLFLEFAREAGLANELAAKVEDIILATANHLAGNPSGAKAWFLDFDLAILGSEEAAYARYADDIRKEYKHVSDQDYKQGRSDVLQMFLDSNLTYRTEEFRIELRERAERNILSEMERLKRAEQPAGGLTRCKHSTR